MNKILKLILSVFGGANVVMSIFIPIAVVLLWLNQTGDSSTFAMILIIVGLLASAFRGIKIMMNLN